MEQGSVLEDGRHGPGPCHHRQGLTQNPEQVGKQIVCGEVAVLSKPTSICGTSHRPGKVQPYPTLKLSVAHQP